MKVRDHVVLLVTIVLVASICGCVWLWIQPAASIEPHLTPQSSSGIHPMTLKSAEALLKNKACAAIEYDIHERVAGRLPFFKLLLYRHADISRTVKTTGEFDAPVGTTIRRYLAKADLEKTTVLDCGGNVGFFSLTCASLWSRVVTIEALPFNAALLRSSLHLNKGFEDWVTLYNVAVGM